MRFTSLPDWAFYPIAALVIGGMIGGALSFGNTGARSVEELLQDGRVFQGEELGALATGNGLYVQLLNEDDGFFARVRAERGQFDGLQSAGAFFVLSDLEREAFQGHRVRMRVVARSAGTNGAEGTHVNLFLPGRGQGQWERVELSNSFEAYDFEIAVRECVWDFAFVSLWPDWVEEANTIDVERIEVSVLEPQPSCA
ncbi:hypothetical protein [Maricaulis sp.]|uniref:hypothetical protein n=1 Tax=Maricaulis sp. TaxID=1486257 RepID=UPI00262BF6A2|nr:hypothetical protein [Maricaulis sp.]